MRNCLAHGRFNFLSEDHIIGFDYYYEQCTAILKLNIDTLYRFCQQLMKYPDFTVSHIIQYILHRQNFNVLATMGKFIDHEGNRKDEELVFARKDNKAFRINCSRYITSNPIRQYEEYEEYSPDYDEDFNLQTQYINIFYTEKSTKNYLRINDSTYVLSKKGLKKYSSHGWR